MDLNETAKVLNRLAASNSKVQIWMILDGATVEMEQDRKPVSAAAALVMMKAAHDTAQAFGKSVQFGLRRYESVAS